MRGRHTHVLPAHVDLDEGLHLKSVKEKLSEVTEPLSPELLQLFLRNRVWTATGFFLRPESSAPQGGSVCRLQIAGIFVGHRRDPAQMVESEFADNLLLVRSRVEVTPHVCGGHIRTGGYPILLAPAQDQMWRTSPGQSPPTPSETCRNYVQL